MTCPEFIVIQSGPFDKGKWAWRIYCPGCGYDDVAASYDEACEARAEHRGKLKTRKKKRHREVVWEEF